MVRTEQSLYTGNNSNTLFFILVLVLKEVIVVLLLVVMVAVMTISINTTTATRPTIVTSSIVTSVIAAATYANCINSYLHHRFTILIYIRDFMHPCILGFTTVSNYTKNFLTNDPFRSNQRSGQSVNKSRFSVYPFALCRIFCPLLYNAISFSYIRL